MRDGPHGANSGVGNRGGVAPTVAVVPLKTLGWAGVLRGSGLYTVTGRASQEKNHSGAAFALPRPDALSPSPLKSPRAGA